MKHQAFQLTTSTSCLVGVIVFIVALATSPEVYAQTDYDSTAAPRLLAKFLVWWLPAYLLRKRGFGGWLFFFYASLLTSILWAVVGGAMMYESLNPAFWSDRINHYLLYLASTVPGLIVGVLVWLLAIKMLFKKHRNNKNLGFIKKLLVAGVVAGFVSLVITLRIGSELFEDPSPFFDIWGTASLLVTALYFYRSQRVQMVLGDNDWDYQRFRSDASAKKKQDSSSKWQA